MESKLYFTSGAERSSTRHLTLWGTSDVCYKFSDGVHFYETPSHGGYKLSEEQNLRIPEVFRRLDGWYEEDCDADIVRHFLRTDACNRDWLIQNPDTLQPLKVWYPAEYEAHFGVPAFGSSPIHTAEWSRMKESYNRRWAALESMGYSKPEGMEETQ